MALPACSPSFQPSTASPTASLDEEAEPPIQAETLESVAKLQRDQSGKVIGVDFRNQTFSGDDLVPIAQHSDLKIVRFGGDGESRLTDDSLRHFQTLSNVKVLAIDKQPITGTALAQWPAPDKLVEFYAGSTAIDDSVAPVIRKMVRLRKIRLSGTQVGETTSDAIATLKDLEEIDLSGCGQLTVDAIAPLVTLPKLRKLNLYDTSLGDDAFAILADASALRWLNLDKTGLTDAGVESLSGLDQLEFLHLGSTSITDAAANSLAKMSGLSKLIVTRTEMTQAGVDRIADSLSDCEIQLQYIAPQ